VQSVGGLFHLRVSGSLQAKDGGDDEHHRNSDRTHDRQLLPHLLPAFRVSRARRGRHRETETGLLVTIRRSKTDRESEDVTIAIARGDVACPARALRES
jgi:hypothetical protein